LRMGSDYAPIGKGNKRPAMWAWWRRRAQRDDRRKVGLVSPLPEIDPIEELARILGEAQEQDAEQERRYESFARERPVRGRTRRRR
jgi:hypothetical protein